MEMRVTWHAELGVAEVKYRDMIVNDDATFDAWKNGILNQLQAVLDRLGHKFPLVVDITGLTLSKKVSQRYGDELAVVVAHEYATAIARYGPTGQTTSVIAVDTMRRALQTEDPLALERRYAANLFADRNTAVEFVVGVSAAKLRAVT